MKPLDLSTMLVYVLLADGGKVEFKATQNSEYDPDAGGWLYWYSYLAQAIIDPYGQRISFTRDSYGRLTQVSEPGTRYLQFFYTTPTGWLVDHVTASDGRTVWYYYVTFNNYTVLDNVQHFSSGTSYYTYRTPNVGASYGAPLLKTCDDPTYPGPMKKIAYAYKVTANPDGSAAVYGQIVSEQYYDGSTIGSAVSTLSVTGTTTRSEIRGDGEIRTFTYDTSGYLTSCTDFNGVSASQGYGGYKWITAVTNRNLKTTNFTRNTLTGVVSQIKYPLTQSDTPGQTTRPTVNYTYTAAGCNTDATIPYWVCTATDEGGNITRYTRDSSHRVTRIDYPDGEWESFTYNSFGQVLEHRLTTGGTETFTYGGRGLKTEYRNAENATGYPTARYIYESHDWVQDITDGLGTSAGDPAHSTSYTYNLRGQVLTITHPTIGTTRSTVTNQYNGDSTLKNVTDELGHLTEYTYDNYKRLKTVKTPLRFTGDTTARTTTYFYDADGIDGTGDEYVDTDAQPTWITLPGGQRTKNIYDSNFRLLSTTVATGVTGEEATTSYAYDDVGNRTKVVAPNEQAGQQYAGKSTDMSYDSRNRVQSVTDALLKTTSFEYDLAGRKYRITRPNGQTITYEIYDEMNRLKQQRVTQTPEPDAVTKWTYTALGGLVATMQDPKHVADGSGENYLYQYDLIGRRTAMRYPAAIEGGVRNWEYWEYDHPGRLWHFTNRRGSVQTFSYDSRHRCTGFSWNDGGVTPSVTFGYDAASRMVQADNANATIDFAYFNDNRLQSETEQIIGSAYWGTAISYTYDANGNRATDDWPDSGGWQTHTYTYTNRNQIKTISNESTLLATYTYDVNGNLSTRVPKNSTTSTYTYDELDRVTRIEHALVGTTKTFDYDYDSVGNRLHVERDDSYAGDAFAYDLADQVTAVQLNVPGIWSVDPTPTIAYDANGNRTTFAPYGTTDTYATNKLNQYTSRGGINATYDNNGNTTSALDGSAYTFDAQNRIISASKNGTSETFKYDALNRQVTRTINGARYDSIWDGWNAIIQYDSANHWTNAAYYGPEGVLGEINVTTFAPNFSYGDASGSVTHLADGTTGALLEWYRYDLDGTPFVNGDPSNHVSAFGVRHLFTGQQWYSELGLYDLRNRFYSPDIGRFLQPDPIGFNGDATNLYRYCGNNPIGRADPLGTTAVPDPSGAFWTYVLNPGWEAYWGSYVPGSHQWCAFGAQLLAGGSVGGTYYQVPNARDYWRQGPAVNGFTPIGTLIATGWQDGRYPSMGIQEYKATYGEDSTVNHAGFFYGYLADGNILILDQWQGKELGFHEVSPAEFNEVYVAHDNGPYGPAGGPGGRGDSGGSPLTPNEEAKLRAILGLQALYNPYSGYLPTTNTSNWAEGIAGLKFSGGSPWDLNNQKGGLDPVSEALWFAGNTAGQGLVSAMEPGVGPGLKGY